MYNDLLVTITLESKGNVLHQSPRVIDRLSLSPR